MHFLLTLNKSFHTGVSFSHHLTCQQSVTLFLAQYYLLIPLKRQKTFGFLFSGRSKVIIGKKRVKLRVIRNAPSSTLKNLLFNPLVPGGVTKRSYMFKQICSMCDLLVDVS